MKKILPGIIFLLVLSAINTVFAQAPVLSYPGGTQSFTAGTAITSIPLTNTGGAVPPGFYGQASLFVPGVYPAGMAMDTIHKILYITNGNQIEKVTTAGVVTPLAGNSTSGAVNGTGSGASFSSPQGLAVDASGNVYVADQSNNLIRKVSPFGVVTTVAGSGVAGAKNGTGTAATFYNPTAVAVDQSGNVYVADQGNQLIRKITATGVVTTLAGSGSAAFADGSGTAASFYNPEAIIIDNNGNIYVSDQGNERIRKITSAGVVTTLAGSGSPGYADGTGSGASFYYPWGLAFDASGNILVADYINSYLRKVTPAGVVTTVTSLTNPMFLAADAAGNLFMQSSSTIFKLPLTGYVLNTPLPAGLSFDPSTGNISGTPLVAVSAANYTVTGYNTNGSATATVNIAVTGIITIPPPLTKAPNVAYASPQSYTAGTPIATLSPTNTNGGAVPGIAYGQVNTVTSLNYLTGITMDASGNVYVATGTNGNQIKKISPSGVVSVFAGTGATGSTNGTGSAASFNNPQGLAIDALGNLYVADANNNLIRKISPAGVVTTLAGNGTVGFANGSAASASFSNPTGVAVDVFGNVYVTDYNNYAVRLISPSGVVKTLAGNGTNGALNGTGTAASFGGLQGIVADVAGNVYVADQTNELIRKITAAGVVTTFAGSGTNGAVNGTGTAASFYYPFGLTLDAAGNLYVSDLYNYLIRRITPAGVVSTLAGGAPSGAQDGTGTAASFASPGFITNDGAGNLYVSDGSSYVRKVSAVGYNITPALPVGLTFDATTGNIAGTPTLAAAASNYIVSAYNTGGSNTATVNITVTGTATPPATVAPPAISYTGPQTYTTGTAIAPLLPSNTGGAVPATIFGQVTTFAGTGAIGRIDGPATIASFYQPGAAVTDGFGNLYVFDQNNYLIRKISPSGIVSTLAGSGSSGSANGTGSAASFSNIQELAIDASGNIYAADESNQLIRKITPAGVVTTLAGSGSAGFVNGTGSAASFYNPTGIAVDASGNVYVADNQNNLIRKITSIGQVTTFAGSGAAATTNGTGTSASFYYPNSLAIDPAGNLYVTEAYGNDVRKITAAKVVTTFAGSSSGASGSTDGTGTGATFSAPNAITADKAGNLYVLDISNNLVRKITGSGVVSTLAGSSTTGLVNNVGISASFNGMTGIAADGNGNVFVSETTNNDIRKIAVSGFTIDNALPAGLTFNGATGSISGTPTIPLASTTYSITAFNGGGSSVATVGITVNGSIVTPPAVTPPNISYASPQNYTAGTTISALTPSNSGGGVPAQIFGKVTTLTTSPANLSAYGLAVDPAGNLYAGGANKIYKINSAGVASVLAGSGSAGAANGKGTAASFSMSQIGQGIAFDAQGNLYVADNGNNMIRKISPTGVVTTYAGKTTAGATNGAIASATFNNPIGIAVDASGNVYVADVGNYLIREITPAGVVSTLAGNAAGGGTSTDGTGAAASFIYPQSLAVDPSGNVYVADGNEIRKIAPGGIVTTLAGSTTPGFTDGTGSAATFSNPYGLTVDATGNIYATDNYSVRKITAAGVVTTIAGSGTGGGSGDGIGASAYVGANVSGIALDGLGSLYVDDGNAIRKISITGYTLNTSLPPGLVFDATTGTISGTPVLAITAANYWVTAYNTGGSSTANVNIAVTGTLPVIPPSVIPPNISYTPATNSYTAGAAIGNLVPANTGGAVPAMIYGKTTTLPGLSSISGPIGIGVDASGNVYVTNSYNIYSISTTGVPSLLAGNGTQGFSNGQGTAASFSGVNGVAIDAQGNKYVADYNNNAIRKISPTGLVTTLAGNGKSGYIDGPGSMAEFSSPTGVAVDPYGNVYVSDTYNNVIRKITPAGEVSTLAGNGTSGSINATGTAASFSTPYGVAVDASGNIYIADLGNNLVRKITPAGTVTTLAGSGAAGATNGTGTAASFANPYGITVDQAGNVYVTDNYMVRKITSAGVVTTLAGVYGSAGTTDGVGSTALLSTNPQGIAVDASGNVYVADGPSIRKISAVGYAINTTLPPGLSFDATSGIISGLPLLATAAANYGVSAYNMGGSSTATVNIAVTGTATAPALPAVPAFSYVTPKIYAVGQAIAALQPTSTGGAVPAAIYGQTSTFAGSGSAGNADAAGAMASFNAPGGLATDVYGNVYVGDVGNNSIRRISPAGVVATIAGSGTNGFANGTGTAASFSYPVAVAVDNNFNIYVADQYNSRVRKITPAGVVTTLAGNGTYGFVNSANGANAEFAYPTGIAVDASGNVYVADANNQKIRKITPAGAVTTFAGSGTAGKVNGTGAGASFNYPGSLAIDAAGNLYVGDQSNYVIRKITPAQVVTTFAGNGTSGFADGTAATASFSGSSYVTSVDAGGNVYVADASNNLIRKVSPTGVVTTIAGGGVVGSANGVGSEASFSSPQSAAADNSGNLYIADASNNVIRKINISGYTINTFPPDGLSFAGTTGIFSGTPILPSANTSYNVTGYNSAGAGNATVNLSVIYPPVVSTTGSTAAFASMGDVTPVPVPIDNSLTVTDQSLTTLASATVSITGSFITGQDVLGFTNVAALMGNITGSYNASTGVLTLNSPGGTATVAQWQAALSSVTYNNTNNVSPNVTNRNVAFVVNDGTFNSAVANKTIGLTYTPSHNDNLASLSVSTGTLSPSFNAATTTYSFGVGNATSSLTVTAASVSLNATITINGAAAHLANTSASVPLGVGNNTISVTVLAQDGIASQTYTINVTRAATQTITFAATNTVTYGVADFAPGATSTNTTIPITFASSNAAVATIVAGNIHIVGAGTTTITASQAGNINFDPAPSVTQTLTVNPATLTITASNQSQVYGAVSISLSDSFSGFVNGETQASLTTQPTLSTSATTASAAGTYPINASGAVDPNYTITYVAGTFTITQASLTITANNQTKIYGSANPGLGVTYSGFVNGDTQSAVTTAPTVTTTALSSSPTGTYPISVSSAVAANYSITYVAGTLTVTSAALTITANNLSKSYGSANPTLTASYSGFVNGDTFASLITQPTLTTTATTGSAVGNYPITVSGAASNNYAISYVAGTLTITSVPITFGPISAQIYGTADFDPGASSSATIIYTSSNTAVATIVSGKIHIIAPGSSTITANNGSSTVSQTLTVTPASLTIAASNQTKVYGGANPTLTVTYTGFVNGDTQSALSTLPAISTAATVSSGVGNYAITASGAASAKYNISYTAGNLSVTAAPLTITANNLSKPSGVANPTLTVTYTGFVNGDTQSVLTTAPAISTTATTSSAPGTYPITVSGAAAANYSIGYVNGTLTVTAATMSFAAIPSKVYGTANFNPGAVSNNPITYTSSTAAVATIVSGNIHIIGVGTSTITATDGTTTLQQTLTVTPASLTITANNQTKVYGAANPVLSVTFTGLVNGDTNTVLTTQPTVGTIATASSIVGSYPITASGAAAANYTISYASGALSVTPAALTITANNQTKVYGAANPTLTVAYSGFVNGDTQSVITTQPTINTTATITSVVGAYPITASGAATPNYTVSYVAGSLTVTTATLTVTAVSTSKSYGAALPVLTLTYSGFVNGDTPAKLTTQPVLTTTATASSPVGAYPITAASGVSSNYSFTYVTGTLTVTAVTLNITAVSTSKTYGSANPAFTLNYTGFVNGDTQASLTTKPAETTTATTTSAVGTYPITVSGAIDPNYAISYITGTLTVNPATLTITANNQTKIYGAANPAFTLNYTGFLNGDTQSVLTTAATVSSTATVSSAVGSYPITASGAAAANYAISYVAGSLSVTAATLTITASNQSRTYGTANPALTVSYSGFVNGDSQSVITTVPTVTTTATTTSAVGSYPITATGATAANYTFAYVAGTLTVNKASLSVTANNLTKTYGAANPALTVTYSGFLNGDTQSVITTAPAITTTATISSGIGSYPITASGAKAVNYTFVYTAGALSVTKTLLTITANNQTKTAGSLNPTLTVSYTGFVNGETQTVLTTQPTVTTTAATSSPAGTYPITASGAAAANYAFSYVAGVLTVTNLVAPKISYTTPQVFSAGTTITALSPVNTGGAVPAASYGLSTTFAGSGTAGKLNGTGTAASFYNPQGVAIDASGNIYVADGLNYLIRKITPAGVVTTFAGSGINGSTNGTGTGASFSSPTGLAFDASGNLYVADAQNGLIRKITPAGVVTTFASGLNFPSDVVLDAAGNVYETEGGGTTVNKITPAGVVSTFASGFSGPFGITINSAGYLFVSDFTNRIFKVSPAGAVTVLAGTGAVGAVNGAGPVATFNGPNCLKVDAAGNVYVADSQNNLIRKISSAGVVTTLAGSGVAGSVNGSGLVASFNFPYGIALDASNNLYVAESGGNDVRKILNNGYGVNPALPKGLTLNAAGVISGTPTVGVPAAFYTVTASNAGGTSAFNINITVNGPPIISYAAPLPYVTGRAINALSPVNTGGAVPSGVYGNTSTFAGSTTSGSGNGTGTAAGFNHPYGAVTDASGNIYIADQANNLIRKITTAGVVTTFAGSGAAGSANGTGTAASFNAPYGLAADASGNIYVADFGNGLIREISPAGVVTTVAGSFTNPVDVAVDGAGNIYTVDKIDNLVQKLVPGGSVAAFGSGFNAPDGVAVDAGGNVYITDASNRIFKVTTAGIVSVFAGTGAAGSTNGAGTVATFNNPGGVKVDAAGNVYVCDAGNNLIRKITPTGIVSTLAGSGVAGATNATGTAASFNDPAGIAIDALNNLYVADANNNQVRKIIDVGYGVSIPLPKGLYINSLGVIGGVPLAASATKIYLVTAYNTSGRSVASISITVKGAPVIKYTTPQVYTTGTTITALAPTNTGGTVNAGILGQVSAFAGSGASGSANGTGTSATFNGPLGIAIDPTGNTYVADQQNNLIRKITPAGVVTTFAGSGAQGAANGTGTAASFNHPTGLGVDQSGNVFVADQNNNLIRKITPAGVVTTFAGSGAAGFANGTGTAASFYLPTSVALDPFNNLYVTDLLNNVIRKITQAGVVTTFAGNGTAGSANGTGTAASFHYPTGIAVDGSSNVYVTDQLNHEIRKITLSGVVTTLAGNGTAGATDGTGAAATFNDPYAVTVDGSGNLYVADYNNNEIRGVSSTGVVTTLAGSVAAGSVNGIGASARFNHPAGVALDGSGNLFEADYYNNTIRAINVSGFSISPALPAGLGLNGTTGLITGTPTAVSAVTTYTVTAYNGGGSGTATLKITINQGLQSPAITYGGPYTFTEGTAIAALTPANAGGAVPAATYGLASTFAGSGTAGLVNGTGTAASFKLPSSVAFDATGNLYVADLSNNVIRKITATGVVTTFAGSGTAGATNGTGTAASFNGPTGIAVDGSGNVYVAEQNNDLIRKISPAGVVTTLAGSGVAGSANGAGTAASFQNPTGLAVDAAGNVYVADSNNHLIRMITPSGLVSTLAGSGFAGAANGTGTAASFNYPWGVAVDGYGNVFVADNNNGLIRKITASGVVTTLAGSGSQSFGNGVGTSASFKYPFGVAVDASGIVYVADQGNNQIRKITKDGVVSTLAGAVASGSVNAAGTDARFNGPYGLALDASGNVYVADAGNNLIRKISNAGYRISPVLPAGLSFDSTTGVISGTPTAVGGPVTYSVIAENTAGIDTTNVTIGVVNSVNAASVPNIYTVGRVNDPYGTARDASGNLYVASIHDNVVYRVDAVTQAVTVYAGTGVAGYSGDGGPATSAQLYLFLSGLAVDGAGNVYIGDYGNNRVRKIDASTRNISTIAGTGVSGNSGNGGPATAAQLSGPGGMAIDANNNIYLCDENNGQILKIDATTKNISTIVTGLGYVERLVFDSGGNLYFGDEGKNTVDKFNISTNTLTVIGGSGTYGNSGDGGLATAAQFQSPMSVVVDATGNVYVADQSTFTIRKIDATSQKISTYAGTGIDGYTGDGASAALAEMGFLTDLIIDNNGYLYVGDNGNGAIRRIGGTLPSGSAPNISYAGPQAYTAGTAIASLSPSNTGGSVPAQGYATVTTLAGNGTAGSVNGAGTAASFYNPTGCVADALGNVYIADQTSNLIRKITPAGVVSTFAGSGTAGNVNGTGTAASFNGPANLAVDSYGNIFVADVYNSEIRKITPSGVVTTFAGSGSPGLVNGTGTAASFYYPQGVAVDRSSNVYVTDAGNQVIRKITSAGVVTTFAGSGSYGFANGTGTAASFAQPIGITADAAGNLYIADQGNYMIRKITPAAVVTTLAGADINGDGRGDPIFFSHPTGITIDNFGNLYVTDNGLLKRVTANGVVATIAGNSSYAAINGIGTSASFNGMYGIAADNFNNLYIAERSNQLVRKVSLLGYGIAPGLPAGLTFDVTTGNISGTPTTVTAGATYSIIAENASGASIAGLNIAVDNPVAAQAPVISYAGPQIFIAGSAISTITPTNTGGAVPPTIYAQVSTFAGSGSQGSANGPGTSASFNNPFALTSDASGNVYVADQANQLIRKITPGGTVTTLAGSGTAGAGNGTGTAASFNNPSGVGVDASGNTYVGDQSNNLIRKITSAGVVTTFAGSSTTGFVNGTGTSARFHAPTAVAVDNSGNVYVADNGNFAIRKITPAGVVTTLAGSGAAGSANGTGAGASFNNPSGLVVDAAGNVYVADQNNQLIRKITPAGVVTTFAGSGTAALADGTGSAASFDYPIGLTIDPAGNLYTGDYVNQVIRKITPAGVVSTIAGNAGISGATNGIGSGASFYNPFDVAADKDGNLYVADKSNSLIRKINLTGYTISPAIVKGLTFNVTTGIISGTPGAIIPATTYSITAYNTAGSSTASLSITVNPANVQAPVIAYAGPQSYPVNTAIAPLTPTNTGGAIPATAALAVSTFAGSGFTGSFNASGTAATFSFGQGNIAKDVSGNLYITDQGNDIIRKITPAGVVSTLAGSGTSGYLDGTGSAASFIFPVGITVDLSGNVYVGDSPHIRKITPAGVVTTLATIGGVTGLTGLTSDAAGNVYAADANQGEVFKITPAGAITTIVSDINNQALRLLLGLTIDSAGNLYGACLNGVIIKITQAGVISTIAGTLNSYGSANGTGTAATFSGPDGITIDASGNLYVTDSGNNLIRKVTSSGVVTTFAGNLAGGLTNSTAAASYFSDPQSLAIDAAGNFYVLDYRNAMIRKIGTTGYTISPVLPAGLTINPNTGVISGTPTVVTAAISYTITAYNSGGTATAVVNIATPATAMAPLKVQTYGAPDFSPQPSITTTATYSSDNPSVATIVKGKIHIVGVGTSTITTLINGTPMVQTLKVIPAQLTISINDKVKPVGTAIPKLTVDYQGFVNGETEDVITVKPIVVTEARDESAAGDYIIKAEGAVAPNYEITYLPGHLRVIPIAVNHQTPVSVTQDQQDPGLVSEPNVKPAVSPNGDGVNDVLLIDNIANFPDNKLVLVGRNGNKIFELEHYDNVNHPFDGHSNINGQLQSPGTYFYLLEYRVKGEIKRKTGFLVLKY